MVARTLTGGWRLDHLSKQALSSAGTTTISNSFWAELRDRRVIRDLAAYGAAVFVVLQAADLILPVFTDATWPYRVLVLLALAGTPGIALLSWIRDFRVPNRLAAAALLGITLLSVGWFSIKRVRAVRVDSEALAVLPFDVNGAAAGLSFLHEGAVDLLATKFANFEKSHVVDPQTALSAWQGRVGNKQHVTTAQAASISRSLGAGRIVLGDVVGQAEDFIVNARIVDAVSGRTLVRASEHGSTKELAKFFDRLGAKLLSLDAGEDEARLDNLTTTSEPALREYLTGRAAYRRSRFDDAVVHFKHAVALDTTFGLAALGVLEARGWSAGAAHLTVAESNLAARTAWNARGRMSALDQTILEGLLGHDFPQAASGAEQCAAWQRASALQPGNAELLHWVADCDYHEGPVFGIKDSETRARREFEQSLAADSTFAPTLQHLLDMTAGARDITAAKKYATLLLRIDTTAETRLVAAWQVAFARQDHAELTRLQREFATAPPPALSRIRNFHDAYETDVQYVRDILAVQTQRGLPVNPAVRYRFLAHFGDYKTIDELLRDSAKAGFDELDAEAIGDALYGEGDTLIAATTAAKLSRLLQTDTVETHRRVEACLVGQWRAWHKQEVERELAVLNAWRTQPQSMLSHSAPELCEQIIHAIVSNVSHAPDARALALKLDSLTATHPGAWFNLYLPVINMRLLEGVNDNRAALTAVRRRTFALNANPVLSTATREEGRLSALIGDTAGARRAYQRYLAWHSNPSGERAIAYTAEAQRQLQRLMADR